MNIYVYVFAHINKHTDTIHKYASFHTLDLTHQPLPSQSPAEINGTNVPTVLYYILTVQREWLCCSSCIVRFLLFSDILRHLLSSIQLSPRTLYFSVVIRAWRLELICVQSPIYPNTGAEQQFISLCFSFILRVANNVYLEVSFFLGRCCSDRIVKKQFPLFISKTKEKKPSHCHQLTVL